MPPRWASLAASACTREGRSRHFDLVGGGGYLWTIDLTAAAILVVGFACASWPLDPRGRLACARAPDGAQRIKCRVAGRAQLGSVLLQSC